MDYGIEVATHTNEPHWWFIVKDVSTITPNGRNRLTLPKIIQKFQPMPQDECTELVKQAVALIKKKIQEYAVEKHILNMDAYDGTFFAWTLTGHAAKLPVELDSPELTDWGHWVSWEVGKHVLSY